MYMVSDIVSVCVCGLGDVNSVEVVITVIFSLLILKLLPLV